MDVRFMRFLPCFGWLTPMNFWLLCFWCLLAFCFSSMVESCSTSLPFFPFRLLSSSFWHLFPLGLWNKVSQNLIFTLLFRSLSLLPSLLPTSLPNISSRLLFSSLAHVKFRWFSIWLLCCHFHKSLRLGLSCHPSAASLLRQRYNGFCNHCRNAPARQLYSWT